MSDPVAFYCVADREYFPGAAALVNSLRLVGHDEPINLLDCGLTDFQRRLLDRHVSVIPRPRDRPPWLLKTVAPLQRPAGVRVMLDADMVATRSLAPLIDEARDGRVVAFRNPVDRFVPEWGELLGLGPARRGPYLSSAAIIAGEPLAGEVLGLISERQEAVDFELTHWRGNAPGYPFTFADQDVFNAVLATRVDPERIVALDGCLAPTPPFDGLSLVDATTLHCSYEDGTVPFLVHHHVNKPWLERTHEGVYSQLLRRLLLRDDVAVPVPEDEIAPWLRRGPRAWAERKLINLRERRKAATA